MGRDGLLETADIFGGASFCFSPWSSFELISVQMPRVSQLSISIVTLVLDTFHEALSIVLPGK